ncbi:MAG: hypothetical protein ABW142_01260 [Thermoleophilaceae bacterium]
MRCPAALRYVVAGSSQRVNAFRRDPATGGLTPIGCGANRKRPACKRRVRAGRLRRTGPRGRNRTRFSGRIGRKALHPGRYEVAVVATTGSRTSAPRRASFLVVRR